MKRGRFYVTYEFLRERKSETDAVLDALEFVPLNICEYHYINAYEYVGISPLFEDVDEGFITPTYRIYFEGNKLEVEKLGNEVGFTPSII